MIHLFYNIEDMRKRDKFFEYVLPWIILALIIGLFFGLANTIIEGLLRISEPISEVLRRL